MCSRRYLKCYYITKFLVENCDPKGFVYYISNLSHEEINAVRDNTNILT